MTSLTAVHESVQADARLVQLKLQAQECIVCNRGQKHTSSSTLQGSQLVSAVTSSSVTQAQQQQQQLQKHSGHAGSAHAIAVLEVVQQHWQALMQERIVAAQMLLPDIPLVSAPRSMSEMEVLSATGNGDTETWRQIGHKHSPWVLGAEAAPTCMKLMYAADDLLHALTTEVAVALCRETQCPYCAESSRANSSAACDARSSSSGTGSASHEQLQPTQHTVQLSLLKAVHGPSRVWLQSFFAELQPDRRQVGLDDVLHSWYRDQQVQQAHNIAASCSAAACRAAARTGIPASARPWVWAAALGLPACPPTSNSSCSSHRSDSSARSAAGVEDGQLVHPAADTVKQDSWWRLSNQRDKEKLELLCTAVKQQALLVDVLTCADVQQLADNAHFFVFEEAMWAVLLAFSRDPSVCQQAAVSANPVMTSQVEQQQLPYPPSGVLPFQGLSAYLAPLCFLYDRPAAMYAVWHAMYCTYWCRLHSLSTSPAPTAGLPVLCRTFLDLLQEVDAEVYQHLGRMTASPLDMVFPWLMSAFASHLTPTETLLLWDRIIGYDSLLPLPVLAVAILTFRRDLILAAETSEEMSELLQEISQLRVVPLLQALLFDA